MSRKSVTAYLGRTREGDRVFAELAITRDDKPATTIEHETVNGTVCLSASGFIIPKGHRKADAFGQFVADAIADGLVKDRSEWSAEDVRSLHQLWRHWHLNDMRAGCAHMDLPEDESYDARKGIICTDPSGGYPDAPYKYGQAWLYEEPPAAVVAEWERLMSLPTGNVPTDY